ncbi:butyrophilin subfamily 1 member A1-like [Centroberyx affinis]|uniref:butyrophilin subfamily 1 member A1-like n=1 Tax=Centroberyx affinis TaxID=166261 RepID=UPI003A5BBBF1
MGFQMMLLYLVTALCASMCFAASENFIVSVPGAPVSVRRGRTAALPCWLTPPKSAEGLEVRWYRDNLFDAPVLRRLADGSQQAEYVGRVSFGLRDAKSDGLKAGDVTLELVNVTLEDAGEYTCYVSSDQGYDKASVSLNVTETGSSPLLSAVWREGDLVNVSCESEGWHPKPELRWSDHKRPLAPQSLVYVSEADSLVSVHSWLLVSSSSKVSCSVGLSEADVREARVRLEILLPETESSMAGWVAFIVTLIALAAVAVLGAMYFKNRGSRSKSDPETGNDHSEETQNLLSGDVAQETSLAEANEHQVNVTLDKTENPHLRKTPDGKIVRDVGDADGEVTLLTSIKGTPGFSSGKYYWEVLLVRENTDPKKSWWVGVTSATVNLHELKIPPTPSNGFWFLSSNTEDRFQFNTEPAVLLPIHSRPKTLGVYLNYDSGELSFYNVEENRHIVTLAARFTGEVFPFFNPGKGDDAPMEILHRENIQCQPSEGEHTSDSDS